MSTDPNDLLDVDPAAGVEPPESQPSDVEEYRPDPPRPDRDGQADEADVVEQATEVPELLDEDDYTVSDDDLPDVAEDEDEDEG